MSINKSEKAFRTISETAEILELPAHVLRFWESKFKHIKPMKRGGGRRYYRPEDIHLLSGIKELLYNEGLTIKGTQKEIQKSGIKEIIRRGASKISAKTSEPTTITSVLVKTEIRETTKIINLQNKKIREDANPEKLSNILKSLRSIYERMRIRCEEKRVA